MPTIDITLLGGFAVTVDGAPVADSNWSAPPRGRAREGARPGAGATASPRADHRPRVARRHDRRGRAEAAQGGALRPAGDRRARTRWCCGATTVVLCPDADTTVDVVRFEELARRALADEDVAAAREALALYGGELLPQDRYEPWAEERREQLRLRHLDLLRLDGRWETVVELDAERRARPPRAHAPPRGERRPPRRAASVRAHGPHAATRARRRSRPRGAARSATASSPSTIVVPRPRRCADRPRPRAGRSSSELLLDVAAGTQPHADRRRSGRRGQVVAARRDHGTGRRSWGSGSGHGTSAPVEGAWPYAPVVEALADLCRRHPTLLDGLADHHREEIDRALAGAEIAWTGGSSHQRLFVAAAELVRLASATNGLLLTVDDVHDADDASLRLLHYIARSTARPAGVHRARPPAGAADRHPGRDATEPASTGTARPSSSSARSATTDVAALVRRHVARARRPSCVEQIAALGRGIPFAVNELARRAANEPRWVQALDANMIGGIAAGHTRGAPAGGRRRCRRSTPTSSSPCPGCRRTEAFDHLDDGARGADRRAGQRRLPVPPRPRARRAARRRAAAPPSPHPPRRGQPPDRAAGLGGPHRPSPSAVRRSHRRPCPTCCGPPRRRPRSAPTATRWRWSTRSGRTPPAPSASDGAVAARRPAQRDRRPDGRRRPTARRSTAPIPATFAACASGSPAAPSCRATSRPRRPRSTASTPTAATTTPTSSSPRGKYAFFTSDFDDGAERVRRGAATGARRRTRLEGARPRRPAGTARAPLGELVRPDAARAASDAGEPGDRQRHLRRLPLPGRVHAVRADAVRRGHRRRPRPAGDRPAQRSAAGRGVRVGA